MVDEEAIGCRAGDQLPDSFLHVVCPPPPAHPEELPPDTKQWQGCGGCGGCLPGWVILILEEVAVAREAVGGVQAALRQPQSRHLGLRNELEDRLRAGEKGG